MLEDQKEELACLYVLGLLDEPQARQLEADAAGDAQLSGAINDLNETLTHLSLASTRIEQPSADLKARVLAAMNEVPARVLTDAEGRIVEINTAFSELCGYTFAELAGQKPGKMLQGPGTDQAAISALREAIRQGISHEVELLNYHRDGRAYWVRIQLRALRDSDGRLTGFEALERELPMPDELAAAQ